MQQHANTEVLAIIPARGGSKSIPRKNIRNFAGHPLIAYSIAAGHSAQRITRLIVSTDDDEIAEIARSYDAEVPFLRPPDLAEDMTPDLPVFQHALHWMEQHEQYRPQIIVQLRPPTPLRSPTLIDDAVEALLSRPDADCVRGVGAPEQTPYKMWLQGDDGFLKPLITYGGTESYNLPRQYFPDTYWHTGHIDVIRYDTLMRKHSMSGERILPIVIEPLYCVDIDTEDEWVYAEWLVTSGKVPVIQPASKR
ncbi:cytidyltransferase [candidate division KSB3 bacterium]|uniref:Cytidyltransferase n=1 Tax=candidate division KSB3 bacterium TaxID=2044937 RepID=A0A2G6EF17_9BACT|nr:MAG: cytidyltransferase [candidate division KSB3 bacterium]